MATIAYDPFVPPIGIEAIGDTRPGRRSVITGRVDTIAISTWADAATLEATITDGTGALTLCFVGRTHIPGIRPGQALTAAGGILRRGSRLIMLNPQLWLRPRDISVPRPRLLTDSVA